MIAANGEEAAENWARKLVANMARRPQGNDRAQVKAIFEGVCDVAIINSYYYGKLKTSKVPVQRKWAKAIQIIFTNQNDRGNHVNISGGGVAVHSKNKAEAVIPDLPTSVSARWFCLQRRLMTLSLRPLLVESLKNSI